MAETTDEQLIAEARKNLGEPDLETVKEACEAFYGHGFADESSGNVEAPTGHFYRVARWIAVTNSQGFTDLHEFETEAEAKADFAERAAEYDEWDDEEE